MFALMRENTTDEVSLYQDSRYLSTNEGVWKFFGFEVHEHWPHVEQLSVHLENGQRVYFTRETAAQVADNPKDTTLTAFFKLCQRDPFARTLLYPEVPGYFTWNKSTKEWHRRARGPKGTVNGFENIVKDPSLGRVYTIHPNQQECYYLRMLLHEVRGPTSFNALKTVVTDDGEVRVCQTFREACRRRGLLEDDAQWEATLQEAAVCQMAPRMRSLFATMLHHCTEISDPLALWNQFKK